MAVDELAVERKAVARVDAADVRADRAAQAVAVVARRRRRCCAARRRRSRGPAARARGRAACRRASGPTILAASSSSPPGYSGGRLRELRPERGDVLVQLAVDEERAVDGDSSSGGGAGGSDVLLVRVAEDELARRGSAASRPLRGRARRRASGAKPAALDRRLREPVGVAEVLDAARAARRRTRRRRPSSPPFARPRARTRASCALSACWSAALIITSTWTPGVAEPRLPVLGRARRRRRRAGSPGPPCPGRNSSGKPGERRARQPERAQTRVAERDVHARLGLRRTTARRSAPRRRPRRSSAARARRVVDPQEQVARERQPVPAHDEALDARAGRASVTARSSPRRRPAARPPAGPARRGRSRSAVARSSRLRLTCSTVRSP